MPAPSVGAAVAFWISPGPVGLAVHALAKAVLYGTPAAWHLLVDRRTPSASPPRRGGFAPCALAGLGLGAAVLLGWSLLRPIVDPGPVADAVRDAGLAVPSRYLLASAWLVLLNAPLEEYAFRWFVESRWRALLRPLPAALAGALCFTAHHVIVLRAFFPWPLTVVASSGVLVAGLAWSACYRRFGSIWPVAVSHALVDVVVLAVGWQLVSDG